MRFLHHSARVRRSILALALLGFPALVHAQLNVGGTIAGDVSDPGNATVAGAQVVIRNQETGGGRELVTSQNGAFSAPSIPVGTYSITVTKEGFAPLKRTGIVLTGWPEHRETASGAQPLVQSSRR